MQRQSTIKYREKSLDEKLTMSPFEKWRTYHIFPCKFFLEIILVILVTIQISLPYFTYDSHLIACKNSFITTFMPEFEFVVFF